MKDILILLLVIVGSFALAAWLSVLFQRGFNLQRRGLLPRVTKKSRAIATFTAFVFAVAYLVELSFLEQFRSIFLLIAVIALVYSFRRPQDAD
jgi:Ca2+/Na+ antiporter